MSERRMPHSSPSFLSRKPSCLRRSSRVDETNASRVTVPPRMVRALPLSPARPCIVRQLFIMSSSPSLSVRWIWNSGRVDHLVELRDRGREARKSSCECCDGVR